MPELGQQLCFLNDAFLHNTPYIESDPAGVRFLCVVVEASNESDCKGGCQVPQCHPILLASSAKFSDSMLPHKKHSHMVKLTTLSPAAHKSTSFTATSSPKGLHLARHTCTKQEDYHTASTIASSSETRHWSLAL